MLKVVSFCHFSYACKSCGNVWRFFLRFPEASCSMSPLFKDTQRRMPLPHIHTKGENTPVTPAAGEKSAVYFALRNGK